MEQAKNSSSGVEQENSSPIKIDSRIRHALDFCSKQAITRFILALPFEVPGEQILLLHKDSRICGVIARTQKENIRERLGDWLGIFLPSEYTWKLPSNSAKTLVYIGTRATISFRMLKASHRQGVRHMVFRTPLLWTQVPVVYLIFGRVLYYLAAKFEGVTLPDALSFISFPALMGETKKRYSLLLATKNRQSSSPTSHRKNRVVLVNSSLVPGGAERQVVNTIKGIRDKGVEPFLLCQHLGDRPDHDFYLSELENIDVPVSQIGDNPNTKDFLNELLFDQSDQSVERTLSKLPVHLLDDILVFYNELRTLEPEVIHAWQDSCGVRAGLAGVLAEVPRIVLSFRNVSPRHFHYHQPYLKPAFQALADYPNVIFTNNSLAGAKDYAHWLGVPPSRFQIVRNGVDFSHLNNPNEIEKANFRNHFGIPPSAPLIGSIFRFYPEKRPLLWVKMAAQVATHIPDAHFILVGWGPLQHTMEDLARQLNLQHRLHIVAPYSNVAVPLSSLDIFVLTSKFEGTPNVVLESQWLGIPIVTTNAGGTPEAINPNITGWVVESARPQSLAKQVVSILRDSDRCKTAKNAGPAFILKEFSMNRMVEETMAAYGYSIPTI